jgi:enoyl-CoA hydratase/carnithine racemase
MSKLGKSELSPFFSLEDGADGFVLPLHSADGTNRLSRECVAALQEIVRKMSAEARPLVITGNAKVFSAGAELEEIAALDGPSAYEFFKMGPH